MAMGPEALRDSRHGIFTMKRLGELERKVMDVLWDSPESATHRT